jgi:phosphonoacetaldehyde hydrolase
MDTKTTTPSGIRAVIFDISGTVLDFGSRGPLVAFQELFARHGTPITAEEARRPMGAHKKDHIREVLADPGVARRWKAAHQQAADEATVEKLYSEFVPIQTEVVVRHADVIPGVPELVKALRARGIKIANTTGFVRQMITGLIPLAAQGGYTPDLWVCPDDVGQGRPAPWMIYHAAKQFGVYPMSAIVKVGDTPADIEEARAAWTWSVAVLNHGNEVGLSSEELAALSEPERLARLETARTRLLSAGPHYIIDKTASLLPVIDLIDSRLARGDKP